MIADAYAFNVRPFKNKFLPIFLGLLPLTTTQLDVGYKLILLPNSSRWDVVLLTFPTVTLFPCSNNSFAASQTIF